MAAEADAKLAVKSQDEENMIEKKLEKEVKDLGGKAFHNAAVNFKRLGEEYVFFFQKSYAREVYSSDEEMDETPCESIPPGLPGA